MAQPSWKGYERCQVIPPPLQEAVAYQHEIDDIMSGGIGQEEEDEDELLAELDMMLATDVIYHHTVWLCSLYLSNPIFMMVESPNHL